MKQSQTRAKEVLPIIACLIKTLVKGTTQQVFSVIPSSLEEALNQREIVAKLGRKPTDQAIISLITDEYVALGYIKAEKRGKYVFYHTTDLYKNHVRRLLQLEADFHIPRVAAEFMP